MKRATDKAKAATDRNEKQAAKNWYSDRYEYVTVQRNVLMLVALLSLIAAVLATLALAWITPLKAVQPFVIQVDEKTGITTVVDPIQEQKLTSDEAIKRYFVVKYITARETYDANDPNTKDKFDIVRLMSTPEIFRLYYSSISTENANAPVNKLGRDKIRSIEFKSITFLDPFRAQARILLRDKSSRGTVPAEEKHMIATLEFEYRKIDLSVNERYINPLGFIVVSYRLDPEQVLK